MLESFFGVLLALIIILFIHLRWKILLLADFCSFYLIMVVTFLKTLRNSIIWMVYKKFMM